jgi:hypothetical protein
MGPARAAWANGQKVERPDRLRRSPADSRRHAHASGLDDPLFECRYPLREWNWDARSPASPGSRPPASRAAQVELLLCGAMKPDEVRALPAWCLRLIVLVEARAAPRLRTVEGLWRRSTSTRPGRMTDFIRAEELLPAADIDAIIRDAPADLIRFQDVAAHVPLPERPAMAEWLETFNAGLLEAV